MQKQQAFLKEKVVRLEDDTLITLTEEKEEEERCQWRTEIKGFLKGDDGEQLDFRGALFAVPGECVFLFFILLFVVGKIAANSFTGQISVFSMATIMFLIKA